MDAAVAELVGMLPEGVVVTAPDALEKYRFDWTTTQPPAPRSPPCGPRTRRQVQATMRWATAHGIPVVPRGAGTGLSGGALAVDGGIVLSLERMRAIEIDPASRVAVVEPGALNVEVKRAAAAEGLWYPPDPSSFEICSIGGNIATNAGGLCCVKYGVTTDYVLGLDVVLADGTLVVLGGDRVKDVAGCRCSSSSSAPRAPWASSPARSCGWCPPSRRLAPSWRPSRPSPPPPRPSSSSAAPCGPRWSSSWTTPRSTPSRTSGPWGWTGMPAPCSSSSPTLPAPPGRGGRRRRRPPASWREPRRSSRPTTPTRVRCSCRPGACTSPPSRARGTVLPEDVGVPVPAAARPARRRRGDRAALRRGDPGGRPRRRRQHPPGDHPHPGRRGCRAPCPAGLRRGHGHRDRPRRHDHRRARRRPAQGRLLRGPARPGRHGAHPPGQGALDPQGILNPGAVF